MTPFYANSRIFRDEEFTADALKKFLLGLFFSLSFVHSNSKNV